MTFIGNPRRPPPPDLAGRTVLVVADDETRDLIAFVLTQCGATIVARADASAALVVLDRVPVDTVITDLQMPGGGLAVARAAHEHGIPVLAVTATSDPAAIHRALAIGLGRIMLKPVDPAMLCYAVVDLIGRRAA